MPKIVQKKSYGSVKIFWLNRDLLIKELIKKAKKLAAHNTNIKKVILFGSIAQNTATPFSDVDIIIIVEKEPLPFLDRSVYYRDSFTGLDMNLDIFVYTQDEFRDCALYNTSQKKGIIIFKR